MQSLHSRLLAKSVHYRKWHAHPHRRHHHWVVFALAFIIGAYAIASLWEKSVAEIDRAAQAAIIPRSCAGCPSAPALAHCGLTQASCAGGGGGVPVCGQNGCEPGETAQSCPEDCIVASACDNDGVIDSGEQCDGSNLNSKTCVTLGFTGGPPLSCVNCVYNTNSCIAPAPSALSSGIWISQTEIMQLPMSGSAWNAVVSASGNVPGETAVGGHGSTHDTNTFAAALVAVRTNDESLRRVVADEILEAANHHVENDGNGLSAARTLLGYYLAADIIDLKNFTAYDAAKRTVINNWLSAMRTFKFPEGTLTEMHESIGNNRGLQAGGVRIAASRYFGDTADVARAAKVLEGWAGNRSAYTGLAYGDDCWQADKNNPVGINAVGSRMMIGGRLRDVDGLQPSDQRRVGCPVDGWPPIAANYAWGGIGNANVEAYLLFRAGHNSWQWQSRAFFRAVDWLMDTNKDTSGEYMRGNNPATGDDRWQLPLIDCMYGSNFWNGSTVDIGKQVGFTDWTHGPSSPLCR